jgi:HEAT repeat protein
LDKVEKHLKKLTNWFGLARLKTIKALGEAGDPRAVGPLCDVLTGGRLKARRLAAEALGKIGSLDAVGSLVSALRDYNFYVRVEAALALSKIGEDAAGHLIKELEEVASEDFDRRLHVIEALEKIGDPAAIPPLLDLVLTGEVVEVRERSLKALVKCGASVPELFSDKLKDLQEQVRINAAWALGAGGDAAAAPPLIEALRDNYETVRVEVVDALGELNDPRSVPALIEAMEDDSEYVRYAAAMVLGQSGDKKAVEPLYQVMKAKEPGWQGAALGLADFGDARAIEPLVHTDSEHATEGLIKIQNRITAKNRHYFCENCLTRAVLHTPNLSLPRYIGKNPYLLIQFMFAYTKSAVNKGYYVCKKCRSNLFFIEGVEKIVLRLSRDMETVSEREGPCMVINWFKRKGELCDYDEIRVMDGNDYDIEELVIKLSNDRDGERKQRMRYIPLYLDKDLTLSQAKLNMLKDHFRVELEERKS